MQGSRIGAWDAFRRHLQAGMGWIFKVGPAVTALEVLRRLGCLVVLEETPDLVQ